MGKQIMTFPAREGRTNDVYFEQCHHWIDDGAQYRDKLQYRHHQPEKKKGFLTGDFKRRDEFSSDFRTRQYREQLQGEAKHARKMVQMLNAQVKDQGEDIPQDAPKAKSYLFDAVFEDYDTKSSGCSKVARDTCNPTLLGFNRDFGTMQTTSRMQHQPPVVFDKPQYARKPVVRDTFYRKTNVFQSTKESANPQ